MKNKLFFTAVFLAAVIFFLPANSESAFAAPCADYRGTCKAECPTGEKNEWAYDISDCDKAATGEICCTPGAEVDCAGGCSADEKCTGLIFKTCEKKDCTDIGCPDGQTCSGLFSKICVSSTASPAASTGTGTVAPPPISGGGAAAAIPVTGGWNLKDISGFGLPKASVSNITGNLLNWLLGILATAGVIGFVISGIIYQISTGDETAVDRAKEAMKWSIVGVIVGLSGVVIIQAVDWALNGFGGF